MTKNRAPQGASQPADKREPKGYDRDVSAAFLRYWLYVLPPGEAAVLGRLIDQIFIFTNGKAERGEPLDRDFLITGLLDGEEIIPHIGFGRSQFDKYLKALKARGLADVIQRGRGKVLWTVNVAAILAKGSGLTGTLEAGRVPVARGEGFRSSAEKGSGPTELVKSLSSKTISKEALPNPTAPEGWGRVGDHFDFEGSGVSAAPTSTNLSGKEDQRTFGRASPDTASVEGEIRCPDRTVRDTRGRYAGSKPHDIEAIKASLGPVGFDAEPDHEPGVIELERVWVLANRHIGRLAMPPTARSKRLLGGLLAAIGDLEHASRFVALLVVHWDEAMQACFGYMTLNPPPEQPDLGFVVAAAGGEHLQKLVEKLSDREWGPDEYESVLSLIEGPTRAHLRALEQERDRERRAEEDAASAEAEAAILSSRKMEQQKRREMVADLVAPYWTDTDGDRAEFAAWLLDQWTEVTDRYMNPLKKRGDVPAEATPEFLARYASSFPCYWRDARQLPLPVNDAA
jgi:hypothetical protein